MLSKLNHYFQLPINRTNFSSSFSLKPSIEGELGVDLLRLALAASEEHLVHSALLLAELAHNRQQTRLFSSFQLKSWNVSKSLLWLTPCRQEKTPVDSNQDTSAALWRLLVAAYSELRNLDALHGCQTVFNVPDLSRWEISLRLSRGFLFWPCFMIRNAASFPLITRDFWTWGEARLTTLSALFILLYALCFGSHVE